MLKTERGPSIVLTSVAVRSSATLRSLLGDEPSHVAHSYRLQVAQMWTLRICNAIVLLLGSSLAAIIVASLLVAAALWGVVIVLAWKNALSIAVR